MNTNFKSEVTKRITEEYYSVAHLFFLVHRASKYFTQTQQPLHYIKNCSHCYPIHFILSDGYNLKDQFHINKHL